MRKKILMSVPVLALIALAAFTSYKTLGLKTTTADLMLDENIEALADSEKDNGNNGFFVHHGKYYDPVTNLETKKCIAYSYYGPNGRCSMAHSHGAEYCCSVNC